MKGVILQPSYIPWRGYFHQIYKADVFVFYDDVQFDKAGWRHRNRVKTLQGLQWLTIPVLSKGCTTHHIPINQIEISWNNSWNKKHWATMKQAYSKAPYFHLYAPLLEDFLSRRVQFLSDFVIELTIALAGLLGVNNTRFIRSSSLQVEGNKTERLVNIMSALEITHYITGPSAKSYLEEDKLAAAGICLEYMTYDYPEYEQLYPPYDPQVSVLDLMFMVGPNASQYIW